MLSARGVDNYRANSFESIIWCNTTNNPQEGYYKMSEEKNFRGVSNTTFIVGLIIAIIASSLISTLVATQFGLAGPKGERGEQGPAGPTIVFAQWDVHWRTLTGDLQWGAEVGTSGFCSTFIHNWGSGIVFLGYDDYIGFQATMQVKMQRDGPVTFAIGGDDGI